MSDSSFLENYASNINALLCGVYHFFFLPSIGYCTSSCHIAMTAAILGAPGHWCFSYYVGSNRAFWKDSPFWEDIVESETTTA